MSDEQLIDHNPAAMRHADDTLAFVDSDNPPQIPPLATAKWVEQPAEHEDTPGQLLATRSHAVIRFWAEARRGTPAVLKAADRSDPAEALRFQVSDRRESEYEEIAWTEWFRMMDDADLVFVYQERRPNGYASDLFRLLPASTIKAAGARPAR